jgi:hypothetical protein
MPHGTETRQRKKQCLVRLTDDEYAAVTAKADRAGIATAAFLRAAALGDVGLRAKRRPPADYQLLRRLLGELGRVGNNLNQIARHLNFGDPLIRSDLREALNGYKTVRDAIFGALGMETSDTNLSGANPPDANLPDSKPRRTKPTRTTTGHTP